MVTVWTDGSSGEGSAGIGVVIEYSENIGNMKSNQAELVAIMRALEMTEGEVLINTDSEYCIGVLTKAWKIRANKKLIKKCKELMEGRDVTFRKIARAKNYRADRLANEGRKLGITSQEP